MSSPQKRVHMSAPAEKPQVEARPIETVYDGYRFRSRLEARWYVAFDALNVVADYEPEGFNLDGDYYLPDFYLPERHVWVETKPDLEDADLSKPVALARMTHEPVVVLGKIPVENSKGPHHLLIGYDRADNLTAGWFTWLPAPAEIGHVLEEPHGFSRFIGRENRMPDMWSGIRRSQVVIPPVVAAAYREARTARFEHGEQPPRLRDIWIGEVD